jgi:hypothetical protein
MKEKAPRRRSILATATLVLALAPAGCGLVSFDVTENIPAQTIAGSPLGAILPAALFSLPLDIDISAETAAHGAGPAKSANLSSLTLTITDPADGTFDFLTSITITVAATDGSLPEVEIGKLSPVPAAKTISIPPTRGVDLLPYITAGAAIRATASGHMPARDTTITGKVVITVHV